MYDVATRSRDFTPRPYPRRRARSARRTRRTRGGATKHTHAYTTPDTTFHAGPAPLVTLEANTAMLPHCQHFTPFPCMPAMRDERPHYLAVPTSGDSNGGSSSMSVMCTTITGMRWGWGCATNLRPAPRLPRTHGVRLPIDRHHACTLREERSRDASDRGPSPVSA